MWIKAAFVDTCDDCHEDIWPTDEIFVIVERRKVLCKNCGLAENWESGSWVRKMAQMLKKNRK